MQWWVGGFRRVYVRMYRQRETKRSILRAGELAEVVGVVRELGIQSQDKKFQGSKSRVERERERARAYNLAQPAGQPASLKPTLPPHASAQSTTNSMALPWHHLCHQASKQVRNPRTKKTRFIRLSARRLSSPDANPASLHPCYFSAFPTAPPHQQRSDVNVRIGIKRHVSYPQS